MKDFEPIQNFYRTFPEKLAAVRKELQRPLTFAEKILLAHLPLECLRTSLARGESILSLTPDRIAMQDATAQMALLQFQLSGRKTSAVPATIHCDHLIRARKGAGEDLSSALLENEEVYAFLKSSAARYGLGFWQPGSGIIHQVVLENYAFPGGLIIGTDSHTPNAGGLGMLAIGVGGADAVDVMVGMPWALKCPKLLGVHLKGKLSGWTAPKDIILKIAGLLTVKGGTGYILEYFGEGARSLSCTGKATITNMGAEVGATTSTFPYDEAMEEYLTATGREKVADLAARLKSDLRADPEVEAEPEKYYDRVIEIDLSQLEPHLVGPHSPDRSRPLSELAVEVQEKKFPASIRAALIGSCTNSSYEDISRAASVAQAAAKKGLRVRVPFLITPGSETILSTIQRDGQLRALEAIGGRVLANACGPCIGQWQREDIPKGEENVIVTSFNRNFPGRNDQNVHTLSFIGSPEVVTALALAGELNWNTREPIPGTDFLLPEPEGEALPKNGFAFQETGFLPPLPESKRETIEVKIPEKSERLQKLTPFPAWNGKDFERCIVLIKAKGKCTTDHISPAGPWLRFRGHLENISRNFFVGGENSFTAAYGKARNILSGEVKEPFAVALEYKEKGIPWIIVGDENYGEGSSREHAAMSPRFLGCRAVLARSFARIHETNLKKQGILPLTFADKNDYETIQENTRVTLSGIATLSPSKPLSAVLHNGKSRTILLHHTLTEEEIHWFRAGSALNYLRKKEGK